MKAIAILAVVAALGVVAWKAGLLGSLLAKVGVVEDPAVAARRAAAQRAVIDNAPASAPAGGLVTRSPFAPAGGFSGNRSGLGTL